jgi:hypothetical protein
MQKNVTGQYWFVYAYDSTTNQPKTGDAGNITADLYLDGGNANAVDDTNPTEIAHGYYRFDITMGESNADHILIDPVSSTANILVIGVPGSVFTVPPYFSTLGIASDGDLVKVNTLNGHTPQTADHTANIAAILVDTGTTIPGTISTIDGNVDAILVDTGTTLPTSLSTIDGKIDTAQSDLDILTGEDGATLATSQPNVDFSGLDDLGDLSDIVDAIAGPGDYAVTLTIRTTGGSAVPGVRVWLNTSNDRTGNVAGTKVTNGSGQVTFNLEYTTYYMFCHLAGYTFASASFTAASGSVAFTKDIATATSAG